MRINKNSLAGRNISPTEIKFAKKENLKDEIDCEKEGKTTPPESESEPVSRKK